LVKNETINSSLVDVAMGRAAADRVIRGGQWVSVQTGEIIPSSDIAIKGSRIAYVGPDASHAVSSTTEIIEAEGRYLVPGLLDGHMHIESSMLTITEFVRAVIPHGTTGLFIDPHEIANIYGLNGIRLMVDEAVDQPVHVWIQVPSCVPSAPGFETPGSILTADEIAQALSWPGVIGLGEVMDFPGVVANEPRLMAEIAAAQRLGKVVGGHYASPDLGLIFHGYAAGGAADDHEGTSMEDAVARSRQGMQVMMRFGSAWHDVPKQVKAVTHSNLDPRGFSLCTDDSHAQTLVHEGHVNRAVQIAIAHGVPPVTAIQMATINTAQHFGVARLVGMIAPGRSADVLLVPDLVAMRPEVVVAQGRIVFRDQEIQTERKAFPYPEWVRRSIKLPASVTPDQFRLATDKTGVVTANVIGLIENQAPNRHLKLKLPVIEGEVRANIHQDLAKIALVERHHNTGRIQVGLVRGFGFQVPCAVASSVAHDCHHIVVVGTSDLAMAKAVNILAEQGGGQVILRESEIIGFTPLPIAGLMSDQDADVVARQAAELLAGFRLCGCMLNNPNMQLSLGLVDVNQFRFIPVLESEI
jgi:adenine deaminase